MSVVEPKKRKVAQEDPDNNFNVYAGAERGTLKGVHFGPELPVLQNCNDFEKDENPQAVVCLAWVDETEKDILVGLKNQIVKTFDTKLRAYTQVIALDVNEEKPMISLYQYTKNFLCGFESGTVSLWNFRSSKSIQKINTGKHLAQVRTCPVDTRFIATGGKKNNLKVWDVNDADVPIYSAKNLPNDELDLEVPVWVQDLTFMPQSTEIISVCSRYGEVMIYDIRANTKNRPVTYMKQYDHPCMSISATMNDRHVLVGTARGHIALIDFRNAKKGLVGRTYKGCVGSVRCIVSHPSSPYFISCGLDAHLYLHDLKQKDAVKKLWLKDRLNCLLMKKDFSLKEAVDTGDANWQVLKEEIKIEQMESPNKKLKKSRLNTVNIE